MITAVTAIMLVGITSFNQINITKKSLIVLDIDETTLQFPLINEKWWKTTIAYYKTIYNCNHDTANGHAYQDWLRHVTETNPSHTDSVGLNQLFTKAYKTDSDIIFLTARFPDTIHITKNHIDYLGITDIPIWFTGGESKGKHLKTIHTNIFNHHDNIILVDDMDHNLHSVKNTIFDNDANVYCYKFLHDVVREKVFY